MMQQQFNVGCGSYDSVTDTTESHLGGCKGGNLWVRWSASVIPDNLSLVREGNDLETWEGSCNNPLNIGF